MPVQTRKPYLKTYAKDIQEGCSEQLAQMKPMAELLDNAMLSWYADMPDFDNFKGIDYTPENHDRYKYYSKWGPNLDPTVIQPGTMKASHCDHALEDGSTWSVTRVGPFKTK